jgi:hypothetical protein
VTEQSFSIFFFQRFSRSEVFLLREYGKSSRLLKHCKKVKVKVKQSLKRPGVAQRVPGDLGYQIFITFGT